MAFCRLSTDGYQSDILCYRRADGLYVVHVATVRLLKWMVTATRVRIGLPFDGRTFAYDDPRPMFAKLHDLAAIGYRVPISALQALREEVASTDGLGEQG